MTAFGERPSAAPERGDWIQTFTGRAFYPADPRPDEIDIRDIAHSLSMTCRYTGHSRWFYSVAQHSMLCGVMAPSDCALEALMHDASEAYLADIARPVKGMLPEYRVLEHKVEAAIAARFGLPHPMSATVKLIDNRMLVTEAGQLMAPGAYPWWTEPHWPQPFGITLEPMSPDECESEFLALFKQLSGRRAQ